MSASVDKISSLLLTLRSHSTNSPSPSPILDSSQLILLGTLVNSPLLSPPYKPLLTSLITSTITLYKDSPNGGCIYVCIIRPKELIPYPIPTQLQAVIPSDIHDCNPCYNATSAIPPLPADLARHKSLYDQFSSKFVYHMYSRIVCSTLGKLYETMFDYLPPINRSLALRLGHVVVEVGDAGGGGENAEGDKIENYLISIKVDVKLDHNGAILLSPNIHSRPSTNISLLTKVCKSKERRDDIISLINGIDPQKIFLGHSKTYTALLKQIAILISPSSLFKHRHTLPKTIAPTKQLVVTDGYAISETHDNNNIVTEECGIFEQLIRKAGQSNEKIPNGVYKITEGPGWKNDDSIARRGLFDTFFNRTPKHDKQSYNFTLPSSSSQQTIIDLLSTPSCPAVVVEGPPGCGKTHSIVNVLTHYLSEGKSVLITSTNSSALSVIKARLPQALQRLVVDCTKSDEKLKDTVSGIADRVSQFTNGTNNNSERPNNNINVEDGENRVKLIDDKLNIISKSEINFVRTHRDVVESWIAVQNYKELYEAFIVNTTSRAKLLSRLIALRTAVGRATDLSNGLAQYRVRLKGMKAMLLDKQLYSTVHSLIRKNAGSLISNLNVLTSQNIAAIPFVGSSTKALLEAAETVVDGGGITFNGRQVNGVKEWIVVDNYMEVNALVGDIIEMIPVDVREGYNLMRDSGVERDKGLGSLAEFTKAAIKITQARENATNQSLCKSIRATMAYEVERFEKINEVLEKRKKLVEAKVLDSLSSSFSPEAASALIKFSQLAGKINLSDNTSKLTARQQRHRSDYMEAFDGCVDFIPCWIMPTHRISSYLRPKLSQFDLVIVDEASQSDCSILPTLLRAKQWLIVGDSRQVSPSEVFVSEESLTNMRANLPKNLFFSKELLPGQSFFELASQAFPQNRVVLNEHYRCQEHIIGWSNSKFYRDRLIPLRVPTVEERLDPSLVDVLLANGVKVGKVNPKEATYIVDDIVKQVTEQKDLPQRRKRTFGVISLIGEEQAKLIKSQLLGKLGAVLFSSHEILVGSPPMFQGNERDVVYLSMVATRQHNISQVQNLHRQRMNVAMSRARDRCVLVRSIRAEDVANLEDVKRSVISYFEANAKKVEGMGEGAANGDKDENAEKEMEGLDVVSKDIARKLIEQKFRVRSMGKVWEGGIAVEGTRGGERAALHLEFSVDGDVGEDGIEDELQKDRNNVLEKQRMLERVGWKSLRLSLVRWILEEDVVMGEIVQFLRARGVHEDVDDEKDNDDDDDDDDDDKGMDGEAENGSDADENEENGADEEDHGSDDDDYDNDSDGDEDGGSGGNASAHDKVIILTEDNDSGDGGDEDEENGEEEESMEVDNEVIEVKSEDEGDGSDNDHPQFLTAEDEDDNFQFLTAEDDDDIHDPSTYGVAATISSFGGGSSSGCRHEQAEQINLEEEIAALINHEMRDSSAAAVGDASEEESEDSKDSEDESAKKAPKKRRRRKGDLDGAWKESDGGNTSEDSDEEVYEQWEEWADKNAKKMKKEKR